MIRNILIVLVIFIMTSAAGAVQAGGDAERGKELAIDCADCHGADGKGDDFNPGIAGLDAEYHFEQLMAYKSGERTDEDELMLMYTEDLSEQDMKDLAAYYATLTAE